MITVEIAFGAEPGTNADTWTWIDVTDWVCEGGVRIDYGRPDMAARLQPARCALTLENGSGRFTPGHAMSPYWPSVIEGVPLRARVDGQPRFAGTVTSWLPSWPEGDLTEGHLARGDLHNVLRVEQGLATVTVIAAGMSHSLRAASLPLESAPRREIPTIGSCIAYWPLEDGGIANAGTAVVGRHLIYRISNFEAGWGQGSLADWLNPGLRLGGDTAHRMRGAVDYPARVALGNVTWAVDWMIRRSSGDWRVTIEGNGVNNVVTSPSPLHWRVLLTGTDVQVSTIAVTDSGTTETVRGTTGAGALLDGDVHHVRLEARSPGSSTTWTLYVDGQPLMTAAPAVAAQGIARIEIATLASGAAAWGHVAAYAHSVVGIATTIRPPSAAVTAAIAAGHAGETATRRLERLAEEERIPMVIDGGQDDTVTDHFARTVASGWGTADSGQAWATANRSGVATFSVTPGLARIDLTSAGLVTATLPGVATSGDFDVRLRGRFDGPLTSNAQLGVVSRWQSLSALLVFQIIGSTSGSANAALMQIDPFVTGAVSSTASARKPTHFTFGTWYWIRARLRGEQASMKVWTDGDLEPDDWDIVTSLGIAALPAGELGIIYGSGSTANDAEVSHYSVQTPILTEPVGPQRAATVLDVFEEAAAADLGVLAENLERPGYTYRARHTLYNQAPAMTIDRHSIALPFSPAADGVDTVNELTVSRRGGAEVTVRDDEHIARYGRIGGGETLSLATDTQLPAQASWRLHVGTWPGMRYPRITPDLDRATPDLLEQWAALRAGDVVRVTDLPAQHPTPSVDLTVQGWAEELGSDAPDWRAAQLNCAHAGPWTVGVWYSTAGLLRPGAPGNYASTPSHPSLAIAGDIDLRCEATFSSWGTAGGGAATRRRLLGKWNSSTSEESYALGLEGRGIRLNWTITGTGLNDHVSAPLDVVDGERLAVRATLQVNNGSGQHVIRFYTAPTITGPWTQHGSTVTVAGTTSIFTSANTVLEVGSLNTGTAVDTATARFHAVEVRAGIDGTVFAAPNFAEEDPGTPNFTDSAGRAWTVHGNAEIVPGPTGPTRYDTDGSRLADLADLTGTSPVAITVETVTGPTWTTDPREWDDPDAGPLLLDIGGVTVAVDTIAAESDGTQAMTVHRVNDIAKIVPAGTPVRLAEPARYAL